MLPFRSAKDDLISKLPMPSISKLGYSWGWTVTPFLPNMCAVMRGMNMLSSTLPRKCCRTLGSVG